MKKTDGLVAGCDLALVLVASALLLISVPIPVYAKGVIIWAVFASTYGCRCGASWRQGESVIVVPNLLRTFLGLVICFGAIHYGNRCGGALLLAAAALLGLCLSLCVQGIYRIVAVNVAGALILSLGLELFLIYSNSPHATFQIRENGQESVALGVVEKDPALGYVNRRNVTIRARRGSGDLPIYDVEYILNENGLREIDNKKVQPMTRDAVLFYGGSFMFGQGVDGVQTLPAAIGEECGIQPYNLGVIGYGAHQMLAIVERGIDGQAVGADVVRGGVYLALGEHVWRSTGWAPWDESGPRYILDEEGDVMRAGSFDSGWYGHVQMYLKRISIFNRLVGRWLGGEEAESVFVAVVSRAARLFEKKWHAPFTVLYWTTRSPRERDARLIRRLRASGLDVKVTHELLGDGFLQDKNMYIQNDGHPSAEAYKRVGAALAKRVSWCTAK